ncbi:MAG: formylglycine-generating enzyme family protein [Planctomycetaceae bacterium]|jgi:formylglycine-generating enzyme required for sulfatase activity|nr:formylglycine-generating enzyme family protein [Planctomycetaceae bacterium]
MRLSICLAVYIISSVALFAHAADPIPEPTMKILNTFTEELVEITPGKGQFPKSFMMGSQAGPESEQPIHKVTFEHSFAIAKYEVPQNLFEAVMGDDPSRWKGPRNSSEMMTHADARQFCTKLTALLEQAKLLEENEIIRLPSEAEWEYCCRAGTKTAYSFGDEARKPDDEGKIASILDDYGWHTGNAAGNDPPVGALKPNPWGLYDMHGYLWEFCADDWYGDYNIAPADGKILRRKNPMKVVIRGGGWIDEWPNLRSAARIGVTPETKSPALGFRCVKSTRENDGVRRASP